MSTWPKFLIYSSHIKKSNRKDLKLLLILFISCYRSVKLNTFLAQAELEYLDLAYNNLTQLEPHYFQVKKLWTESSKENTF